jgi:hypothetical protein
MSAFEWVFLFYFLWPISEFVGGYWGSVIRDRVDDIREAIERFRSWREGRRGV